MQEAIAMSTIVKPDEGEFVGVMVCPNCGAKDPYPPTESDNATTTCPRCGHRFPVSDEPEKPR